MLKDFKITVVMHLLRPATLHFWVAFPIVINACSSNAYVIRVYIIAAVIARGAKLVQDAKLSLGY